MLELLIIERQILRRKGLKDINQFKKKSLECQEYLCQIDFQMRALDAFEPLHLAYRLENIPNSKKEKYIKDAETTLHAIESVYPHFNDIPFSIQRTYFSLKFNYLYFYKKNISAAYKILKKYIYFFEENKRFIIEKPEQYIRALYNYLSICLNLKKFNEVPIGLNKIRSVVQDKNEEGFGIKERDILVQVFQHSYNLEYKFCLFTKQYEKANRLLKVIKNKLPEFEKDIPNVWLISFFHNISAGLIMRSDYEEAIYWINKTIYLDDTKDLKTHVKFLTIFFQIIAHFELNNYGLITGRLLKELSSFHKKYEKHLPTKDIGGKEIPLYEKKEITLFITTIRRLCNFPNSHIQKDLVNNLIEQIQGKWPSREMKEVNHWLKYKAKVN